MLSIGSSIEKALAIEYCDLLQELRNTKGPDQVIEDMDKTLRSFYKEKENKLLKVYTDEMQQCYPYLFEKTKFYQYRKKQSLQH